MMHNTYGEQEGKKKGDGGGACWRDVRSSPAHVVLSYFSLRLRPENYPTNSGRRATKHPPRGPENIRHSPIHVLAIKINTKRCIPPRGYLTFPPIVSLPHVIYQRSQGLTEEARGYNEPSLYSRYPFFVHGSTVSESIFLLLSFSFFFYFLFFVCVFFAFFICEFSPTA